MVNRLPYTRPDTEPKNVMWDYSKQSLHSGKDIGKDEIRPDVWTSVNKKVSPVAGSRPLKEPKAVMWDYNKQG